MEPEPGLHSHRLSKTYSTREGDVAALADVSFHIRPGEFVSLVGPSGCGKTTLLKLLAGLTRPSSGSFTTHGLPKNGLPANALVFQEHGLFPWMPVLANAAFGLEMQGVGKAVRQARALAFLENIGLADFARNYPHELSTGMRQRVAIARAFLTEPQILLMDEPFNALDAQSKLLLQEELLRIWKQNQRMVFYVTHDIEEAVLLGDRVLVMSGRPGRIIEEIEVPIDRPRDLLDRDAPVFRQITRRVWERIESEVRRGLRMPG
jgi:NitT/TauT family transport system ATP-binding protein